MTLEVTLDLETLDLPGSKKNLPTILSIGACLLDSDMENDYDHFIGDKEKFVARLQDGGCFATDKIYYSPISLVQSMSKGFTVGTDTAKFWDKQTYNMVEQAARFRETIVDTFNDFARWLKFINAKRVWANSPSFDTTLLRDAFDHVGLKLDIFFRDERDVRTGVDLMEVKWPESPAYMMKHHAVCDAIVEARLVQSMYAKRRYWQSLELQNEQLRNKVAELESVIAAVEPGRTQ